MNRIFLLLFFIAVSSAQSCLSSADRLINKRCFTFVNQQLNYRDARDWCHFRNPVTFSYLATVPDTTTANFLASYARTIFNSNDGSFWIGLSRYNTSSRFQWDDGTPVSWTNFQLQNAQNYVAESITNAKFSTYAGDNKYNFICSYDPNGSHTGRPTYQPDTTTAYWVPTAETDKPPGPTPTAPTTCTRHTNSTILFAYSTDSLQYDVNAAVNQIVHLVAPNYGFTTYANVRIDVKNEEDIQYHRDLKSFNASVYDHPTNSSIGYGDTSTGSDVFKMIEKFLNNNNQAPVCGSIIYVLVKRYPNSVDVTNLVNRLRDNHVFVYFIVHTVSSGGSSTQELFDMASRTNGFCIFMDTRNYWVVANSGTAVMWRPYQFLAHNYIASGSGRIELPVFRTPNPKASIEQMLVVITVQDHAIDSSFVSLNYTIASTDGNYTFVGPDKDSGYPRFGTGIIAHPSGVRGLTDLKMTIDYNYRNTEQQVIEVRMHSNYYHDFVPFATTDDGCTRRTNTTILLAYSTDSVQYDVDVARSQIVFQAQPPFFYGITTFANVRFDMKNEEEIQYHSDVYAFNASVNARPVDGSLGYEDTTIGSDVFEMIRKFVNNKQAPTCGSIVYVLVKRYPNDVDVTNLITQLRANQIFVYFIVHNIPSGGTTTDPLFEMASKTNGFSVFMGNPNYWVVVDSGLGVLYRPYQYFAQNYQVSGAGRIEIPTFKTPSPYSWEEQVMVVVTIQDHKLDSNYVSLNYTISTADNGRVISTAPDTGNGNIRFGSGIIDQPQLNGTTGYKMTIDYNYRTTQQQMIEVRMYSSFYNDFVALPGN